MPALWMGLAAGAVSIFSGAQQAEAGAQSAALQQMQAQQSAANRRAEWAHSEFMRESKIRAQNRDIAKANALKWLKNKNIANAANKTRAEEEFYIRYNFNREVNNISSKVQETNNALLANFGKRNINMRSATAKRVVNMALEDATGLIVDSAINKQNKMRSAERKQAAALASRDFGYKNHTTFIPGMYLENPIMSPEQAYDNTYSTGMASALMGGVSSGLQGAMLGAQIGSMNAGTGDLAGQIEGDPWGLNAIAADSAWAANTNIALGAIYGP
jgi:hypothetical protein